MPDRGPMAPTNEKLDQVLLELYSLNLTIRDLALAEREPAPAPVINVTSPGVDLTPLAEALSAPAPQLDLAGLYEALSVLNRDSGGDAAVLAALKDLHKELKDLGSGMRAIAGQPSMGGGGQVFLPEGTTIGLNPADVAGLAQDATLTNGTAHVQVDNFPATQPVSGTVAVSNQPSDLKVHDDYQGMQILADQTGAGAVLTFTFTQPVMLFWVTDTGLGTTNVSRCDPTGGTPSSTSGVPVYNSTPTPFTYTTSSVKVFAPAGSAINVYGYFRT